MRHVPSLDASLYPLTPGKTCKITKLSFEKVHEKNVLEYFYKFLGEAYVKSVQVSFPDALFAIGLSTCGCVCRCVSTTSVLGNHRTFPAYIGGTWKIRYVWNCLVDPPHYCRVDTCIITSLSTQKVHLPLLFMLIQVVILGPHWQYTILSSAYMSPKWCVYFLRRPWRELSNF